ncbi:MAG: IPT/TIG domain-containing protein, partial [Actinobacteria bacterium]|nr:IPT/TIG domain-containing protein [Actinomycetota bacterium]
MLRTSSSLRKASVFAACFLAVALLLAVGAVPAAAAEKPIMQSVTPTQGQAGDTVYVSGWEFGASPSGSTLTFNGVVVPYPKISYWADNLIVATVPDGATTGPVVVTTAEGPSNTDVIFTITAGPAQTWYLAEGSTLHGFDTYVLMANPNASAATVNVVYNTNLGRIPRPVPITVPANSRVTLHVSNDVPNVEVSTILQASVPIVAERAVYWNDRIEGTDSIGVTAGSKTWYLAEGSTSHGFETWVLIQNPGTAEANVTVTYMTSNGIVKKPTFPVAAGQRYTIDVGRDVGFCDVSTKVESDQDIVCERSMYWDARRGGHDSIGVTSPSRTWYLAEGSTAWGFETYLLIQNPSETKPASVNVTYMTRFGPAYEPAFIMGPG